MMDANEARQMTEKALSPASDVVRPYVEHALAKVARAAKKGQRQIAHPLSGSVGSPSPDTREAVRKALEAKGFTWTHHPDPDPDDPRGGAYDTAGR